MQSARKRAEKISLALCEMERASDDKLQLRGISLTLRTALNMAFLGTSEAAHAAKFVEKYVPFGEPLSDPARRRIARIIERLEAEITPVFAPERLADDLFL